MLFVLWAVYVSNQWSRSLLANTVNFGEAAAAASTGMFVNVDLGFDREAYARMLTAFLFSYISVSLPAGWLVDKVGTSRVLSGACLAWAGAMSMHARATSARSVLLSRALLGAAAAVCSPASNCVITSAFPPERRGGALGVYVSGVYVGAALASVGIAATWRANAWVLAAVAVAGAAAIAALVPEPRKGPQPPVAANGSAAAAPMVTVLRDPTARLLLFATATRFCAGYSIQSWFPQDCKAKFPDALAKFTTSYAAIILTGGLSASFAGGVLSDVLDRGGHGGPRGRLLVPLIGSALALPLFWVAVTRTTLRGTLIWFGAHVLCSECWLGPTIATLLGTVPEHARGTAQGLVNTSQAFAGLLQVFIARLAREHGTSRVLIAVVSSAYAASSLLFLAICAARGTKRWPPVQPDV